MLPTTLQIVQAANNQSATKVWCPSFLQNRTQQNKNEQGAWRDATSKGGYRGSNEEQLPIATTIITTANDTESRGAQRGTKNPRHNPQIYEQQKNAKVLGNGDRLKEGRGDKQKASGEYHLQFLPVSRIAQVFQMFPASPIFFGFLMSGFSPCGGEHPTQDITNTRSTRA